MKNTLMFLLASLLLAFSLTACGGGQTTGSVDGSTVQSGSGSVNEGSAVGGGNAAENGSVNGGSTAGDGLMDGARDAVDGAGRSVRGALDDAGDAIDRAF